MSFTELNLHPNIAKAIAACGYTVPTSIQKKSIPSILEGKDVVASAQTGTGKTAAFVLPALHLLSTSPPTTSKKPRILILTPTRELATQITAATTQYGKFLKFKFVNLVGGMPYHQQIRALEQGADIVIATPGRLLDLMESKRVDLSEIKMLILDEADRMLDMGFIDDVEYIAKLTPSDRQTLLFSATVDKKIATIVRHLLKNPVRIELSEEKTAAPLIEQQIYKANSPQHKFQLLKHFLNDKNMYKAIIFCATKISADRIADRLCDEGFSAAALHGDLRQNVRNRTLEQLRRGKIQFLVATDVAARGIDISDITHVINYDLPRSSEDYVHRIGRTGRAGKSGIAISFAMQTDMRQLQRIERYIGQRLHLISNIAISHDKEPRHTADADETYPAAREFAKPEFKKERSYHQDRDRPAKKRSFSKEPRSFDRDDSRSASKGRPFKKRSEHQENFETDKKHSRDSFGDDRPFKKRAPHKDRFDNDKPFKKRSSHKEHYDNDRKESRSASGDKPFKKRFPQRDHASPERSERSERSARSERSERPDRSDRKSARESFSDRPMKKRPEMRRDREGSSRNK